MGFVAELEQSGNVIKATIPYIKVDIPIWVVFRALGAVLAIAGPAIDKVLFDLLVTVGVLVGAVLTIVFTLVGTVYADLVFVIVPLLKVVVPFILHLNIATVISLLKL